MSEGKLGPFNRDGIRVRETSTGRIVGEACGKNIGEEWAIAELFAAAPDMKTELERVESELGALLECVGWQEALASDDPGAVPVWAGPRIHAALDAAKRGLARARGEGL